MLMSSIVHNAELSRRDDLESLGYMCLEFLRGDLSWQALDRQQMGEKKQAMPVDNVFKEFDSTFFSLLHCCLLNTHIILQKSFRSIWNT